MLKSPERGSARGPIWWAPRSQRIWPCGPPCFGPCGSPRVVLLPYDVLPTKNQPCNFPFSIWVPVAPETLKTRKRRFSFFLTMKTVGEAPTVFYINKTDLQGDLHGQKIKVKRFNQEEKKIKITICLTTEREGS